MLKSNIWKIIPLLLIAYVAVGDMFLPPHLAKYSTATRLKINNYLVNAFPDTKVESPYGKNDEMIMQIEKGK